MLTFLGAAGAFLLVLVVIFIVVLRRFLPGKEQPWHPLPPEEEKEDP